MGFRAVFHRRVETDVLTASAFYSGRAVGLAEQFKRTFYDGGDDILRFPKQHAIKVAPEIRTRLLRPFPYLIFDVVQDEVVFLLAVQYAGRKPERLRTIISQRDSST